MATKTTPVWMLHSSLCTLPNGDSDEKLVSINSTALLRRELTCHVHHNREASTQRAVIPTIHSIFTQRNGMKNTNGYAKGIHLSEEANNLSQQVECN